MHKIPGALVEKVLAPWHSHMASSDTGSHVCVHSTSIFWGVNLALFIFFPSRVLGHSDVTHNLHCPISPGGACVVERKEGRQERKKGGREEGRKKEKKETEEGTYF